MSATVIYPIFELPMHGGSDGLAAADARDRRYWDVQLSAPDANAKNIALAATGIPALGDPYPGQGAGYCVLRRSADPNPESKHGVVYRVMVEYGINPLVTSGANAAPWLQERLIDWTSVGYQVPMEKDKSTSPNAGGIIVANGAGDPFDPPIMTTKYNKLATIRWAKLLASFDPDAATDLIGTLNQSQVTLRGSSNVAATKGLLRNVTAREVVYSDTNQTHYWDIVYEIEVENEWPLKNMVVQNKGYNFYTTASTPSTKRVIGIKRYDASAGTVVKWPNGKEIIDPKPTPSFLNADGTYYTGDPNNAPTLIFVAHSTASWSALGL